MNSIDIVDFAAPELDEESPDIYKLPIELIMGIFNFLPLEDLNSVCLTSKWWQQLACVCFQQNYPSICVCLVDGKLLSRRSCKIHAFKHLFEKFTLGTVSQFEMLLDNETEYHQMREITLNSLDLTKMKIERMKPIFKQFGTSVAYGM